MSKSVHNWRLYSVYSDSAVHCTNHIIAHQSGSQFTTCVFYVHHYKYSKQQFLTTGILTHRNLILLFTGEF
jgi:hypothetical protein